MSCGQTIFPTAEPIASELGENVGALSLLIRKQGIPVQEFHSNRTTDARTAIKRGLAEYLEQVAIDLKEGRRVSFKEVFEEWAEPEDIATFPSAVVYFPDSDAVYESTSMFPSISTECRTTSGDYLIKYSEMTADVKVEAYATDPEERIGLAMMLEDALNPVDWMYGFYIQNPHYYNARSRFELKRNRFPDNTDSAFRRNRIGAYTLSATIPVARLVTKDKLPMAKIAADFTVIDGNDC